MLRNLLAFTVLALLGFCLADVPVSKLSSDLKMAIFAKNLQFYCPLNNLRGLEFTV
jgi:hypothetical protein